MRWQRLTTCAGLLVAWAVFAWWQNHEYGHERELARKTLRRQAKSVMNALVGGIRSHRRLGWFFQDQLQGVLNELVTSEDVLAVQVASEDGRMVLTAGDEELLNTSEPIPAGSSWDPAGFRLAEQFELLPERTQPHGRQSGGRSGGPGGGLGLGRGRLWCPPSERGEYLFPEGGKFLAILLLDRTQADTQSRRAAWLRISVAVAGGMVLVFVALAWRATVRLTEARGRERVLQAEARHLRELSQAAAGLAHETRNPLGVVRGWAQQLTQSESLPADQQEHTRAMVEECDRLTARINQFLAFAKPCEPSPEPVDPDRIIDELTALLQPDLDAKDLKLTHLPTRPARTIRADREMLRQALFNLMQNAIQFAPRGETVEVGVSGSEDGFCRIEVADPGPGVADDAVDLLFTPYFTTRADGTGLGLAIVRRIAGAHGWQVGYSPREGSGSVFWLDHIHG